MSRIPLTIPLMLISLLAHAGAALAQAPAPGTSVAKVTLRNVGRARVSITKGRLHQTIDLSAEVAGCSYVSGPNGIDLRKRGCAASPATFKLIDTTAQNGNTYFVVLSEASGNCNVCGQCGASEAYALIWLELDPSLRVRNKRSVPIEACRAFIALVSPKIDVNETAESETETLNLAFKNDRLVVEFEETIFADNGDKKSYRVSHLKYDRREPGLGFIITTETREKSAQPDPVTQVRNRWNGWNVKGP